MARRLLRPKFLLRLAVALGIIYTGTSLIHPIRFAVRYHGRNRGPTATHLEEIIRDKKIPSTHLDKTVFLKLHEDYFRHGVACSDQAKRIIFIPDNDRNYPDFYLYQPFSKDVCHEIGHNGYEVISITSRKKWEDYVLRLLDTDLRHWQYISKLEKLRSSAFKRKDINEVKSLDHQISTLYRYSILPAKFDNNYNVIISIGKTQDAFDPEELFAETYATYLTGIYDGDPNERKEARIKSGMEKPELEDLWSEGMRLMEGIVFEEGDGHIPSPALLDSRDDFFKIWCRYLNPLSSAKVLVSITRDYSFDTRVSDLCNTYLKKDHYVKSKN